MRYSRNRVRFYEISRRRTLHTIAVIALWTTIVAINFACGGTVIGHGEVRCGSVVDAITGIGVKALLLVGFAAATILGPIAENYWFSVTILIGLAAVFIAYHVASGYAVLREKMRSRKRPPPSRR